MELVSIRRPASTKDAPTLVLMHGLASDEQDLIGLAPELDPELDIISLRAPHESGYGGYAWFAIEFLPDGSRRMDEGQAEDSLAQITQFIEQLDTSAPVIVGGFSQGAMMAAGVLLRRPDLVDGALLMSGRLIPAFDPGSQTAYARRVLAQHGRFDPVLAVDEGRELAETLEQRGHQVTWREYDMAHQVSLESVRDAASWVRGVRAQV